MKSYKLEFVKAFSLPAWDESTRSKAISFWTERGIQFSEIADYKLIGKRGDFMGNLLSFDMSKLRTKLIISVSDQRECTCRLLINTSMQQITPWNREYWQLELDTFESFIIYDDAKEQGWVEYKKKARGMDIKRLFWIALSSGLGIHILRMLFR